MPTIFRIGRVQVRMFFDDHHPPHCHLWTPDGEMQIALGDLSTMRGRIGKQDYQLAMAWIQDNIEYLWQEWNRLNG